MEYTVHGVLKNSKSLKRVRYSNRYAKFRNTDFKMIGLFST